MDCEPIACQNRGRRESDEKHKSVAIEGKKHEKISDRAKNEDRTHKET